METPKRIAIALASLALAGASATAASALTSSASASVAVSQQRVSASGDHRGDDDGSDTWGRRPRGDRREVKVGQHVSQRNYQRVSQHQRNYQWNDNHQFNLRVFWPYGPRAGAPTELS